MRTYHITIFRQSRVLIGLFILPVAFIGLLLLGLELGNFLLGIFFFALYLILYYFFVVGHLTVYVSDNELKFEWKKKLLFNYKHIESIKLSEIQTIVIDKGQFLRKLITKDKTVYINTTKVKALDSYKIITFLQIFASENNVRVINSWREWAEKGYLRTAYRIGNLILILVSIAIVFVLLTEGFSSKIFMLLFFYIPVLIYQREMKKELDYESNRTATNIKRSRRKAPKKSPGT